MLWILCSSPYIESGVKKNYVGLTDIGITVKNQVCMQIAHQVEHCVVRHWCAEVARADPEQEGAASVHGRYQELMKVS